MSLPPPSSTAKELPLEPTDTCTVSTPSTSRSLSSTVLAAESAASRLVPAGIDCDTESVFCPLLLMKLVGSLVARNPLPPRISSASTSTIAGARSVQRMIGR